MKRIILLLLMSFYMVSLSSRADVDKSFYKPTLTTNDVIKHAHELILENDILIDEYNLVDISYDYIKRIWFVFYIKKVSSLGGHFLIRVNDADLTDIELIGGL